MKGLHHQVARYYYWKGLINSKQIYLFVPTLINGSLANSGTQTLKIKYNSLLQEIFTGHPFFLQNKIEKSPFPLILIKSNKEDCIVVFCFVLKGTISQSVQFSFCYEKIHKSL